VEHCSPHEFLEKGLKMANVVKVLTPDQLKRLRRVLVEYGVFPSQVKALKATDTAMKCRVSFLQLVKYVDDFSDLGIDDIIDMYTVPDAVANRMDNKAVQGEGEVNPVDNKAVQVAVGANHVDNKPVQGVGVLNSMDNKPVQAVEGANAVDNKESELEPKKRKGRGKQKAASMAYYTLRLPDDMLQQLKGLEGTVSEHIRRAIGFYLKTIKLQD